MKKLTIGDRCFIYGCIAEIVGSSKDSFNIMVEGVFPLYRPVNEEAKRLRKDVDLKFDRVCVNPNTGFRTVRQFNPITAYAVSKDSCEPLVNDMFDIGDHIETNLTGGGLVGHIESFIHHDNRAVCISDKINGYQNDRTRYAYKPTEIIRYTSPIGIRFEPGQMYEIDNAPMQVIKTSTDCLGLVDKDFTVRYTNVPRTTTDKHLMKTFKIKSVKHIDHAIPGSDQIAFAIII